MLHWLNTHIGNDWATYQSLGLAIISLGFTVFAAQKIIKKYKLRQTNKNNSGNINQAGRDLNITTINNISHAKVESGTEEKKKAHDFNNSACDFLSADRPERKPLRLELPYDWKNHPEREKKYRQYQSEMRETSAVIIENYKLFIKTIKENEFITDTI
ncbi:TPA: hypothetical protein ACHJX8_003673 [Yersinia enterocolitica]